MGVLEDAIELLKTDQRAIDVLHAMRRQVKLLVVSGLLDALMSCRVLDAKAAADLQSEHGLQQVRCADLPRSHYLAVA